jgi:hypothetical protein
MKSILGPGKGGNVETWIRRFRKETFRGQGLLNTETFQEDVKRKASIAAKMRQVSHTVWRFDAAVKKAYGKNPGAGVMSDLDAALKSGDINTSLVNGTPIPTEVQGVLQDMRGQVDALSKEMVLENVVDGKLATQILDNLDVYIHRSYRVHDDPAWTDTVKENEEVWNTAGAWFQNSMIDLRTKLEAHKTDYENKRANAIDRYNKAKEGTKAREKAKKAASFWQDKANKVDGAINKTYDRQQNWEAELEALLIKQAKDQVFTGQGGALGSKKQGILKKLKNVPKPLRDLYGEYEDPIANYTKTIYKQAHLVENHKFLKRVENEGVGNFLFTEPQGEFTEQIAADSSSPMAPLSGYYTHPDIAKGFREFEQASDMGAVMNGIVKLSAVAKTMKTIASPLTHVRNFVFNFAFHVANGHLPGSNVALNREAWNLVLRNDIRMLSKNDATAQAEVQKLIELGVIHDSNTFGEMRELLNDAFKRMDTPFSTVGLEENVFVTAKNKIMEFAQETYRAEDDFHKVIAFRKECVRYAKALHGQKFTELSDFNKAEIEKLAAGMVVSTMPTYSNVSPNFQKLRRLPFTGTFISFPYEIVRTFRNNMSQAVWDITNTETRRINFLGREMPATAPIGLSRLIGMSAMTTGMIAVSKAAAMALGMDDDDQEDFKYFLPPWSQNSIIVPVKKDGANYTYIDISTVMPHSYLLDPVVALLDGREDEFKARMGNAMWAIAEPFFSEDMTFKAVYQALHNRDSNGNKIVSEDAADNAWQRLQHAGDVFTPGAVSQFHRLGKAYIAPETKYGKLDPVLETISQFSGVRVSPTNIEKSFYYRSLELGERSAANKRIYRSESNVAKWDVPKHKEEIKARHGAWNNAARAEFKAWEAKREAHLNKYKEKAIYAYERSFADAIKMYDAAVRLGGDPAKLKESLKGRFTAGEINHIVAGKKYIPDFK